ncbi:MAG: cobalamin biosynthesis protein CbiX [Candidatus Latescibacteria bacterium]|nr:cobalamin biosynthesis protein CbiX [Candidatus Latescibacterota bacterium]
MVAPDRGFLGNEEIQEAFDEFAQGRNAWLVFATDERTRGMIDTALAKLVEAGARRVAVLPFFISPAQPRFALVKASLAPETEEALDLPVPVSWGRAFGESYLAVEVLADHFRALRDPAGRSVVVVGCGAGDAESRQRMEADWQRIAERAAEGFGFASIRALVWPEPWLDGTEELEKAAERELLQLLEKGTRPVVVPFHLGKKLDSMMSFTASLRRLLPASAELIDGEVTPHPAVAAWMAREANRFVPLHPEEIGVVFLAHGSDYHWNETMRESVRSLSDRYKIEFAFCMADPPLVERAVHRLEDRGARAIVVVRVFGLAANFQESVERMLGLDVEKPRAAHGHDHGHGHVAGPPGPRIRSSALLATAGGLEDHPLFARALLDRAQTLSRDPARETVILVAHGSGDDSRNAHWGHLLESLADQMRADGGAKFRAIHAATWREDWPDKREPEVAAVRRMVEEAARDGGRAIVIPARTTGQGMEEHFLKGLNFDLGVGFAPHPLFASWVEEQIQAGIAALGITRTDAALSP